MIDYVKSGRRGGRPAPVELTAEEAEAALGSVADEVYTDSDTDPRTGEIYTAWVVVTKDLDFDSPYYVEGKDELFGDDPEAVLDEWLGECRERLEAAGCKVTYMQPADGCDPFTFNPEVYTNSELRADFMYDDF